MLQSHVWRFPKHNTLRNILPDTALIFVVIYWISKSRVLKMHLSEIYLSSSQVILATITKEIFSMQIVPLLQFSLVTPSLSHLENILLGTRLCFTLEFFTPSQWGRSIAPVFVKITAASLCDNHQSHCGHWYCHSSTISSVWGDSVHGCHLILQLLSKFP